MPERGCRREKPATRMPGTCSSNLVVWGHNCRSNACIRMRKKTAAHHSWFIIACNRERRMDTFSRAGCAVRNSSRPCTCHCSSGRRWSSPCWDGHWTLTTNATNPRVKHNHHHASAFLFVLPHSSKFLLNRNYNRWFSLFFIFYFIVIQKYDCPKKRIEPRVVFVIPQKIQII